MPKKAPFAFIMCGLLLFAACSSEPSPEDIGMATAEITCLALKNPELTEDNASPEVLEILNKYGFESDEEANERAKGMTEVEENLAITALVSHLQSTCSEDLEAFGFSAQDIANGTSDFAF